MEEHKITYKNMFNLNLEYDYFNIKVNNNLIYKLKRKTPIYEITSGKLKLGEIKWYGPWRKFCFYPEGNTLYDSKCLKDITNILEELYLAYKLYKVKEGNKINKRKQ